MRVLARRPRGDADVEWVKGDLATGEGVAAAVAGVDAIVHAATNSPAARRGRFKFGDLLWSPAEAMESSSGRSSSCSFVAGWLISCPSTRQGTQL